MGAKRAMRLSPHDPLTFNMQTATAAPTFFVGNNAAAESHGTLASTHAELNISGLKDLFPIRRAEDSHRQGRVLKKSRYGMMIASAGPPDASYSARDGGAANDHGCDRGKGAARSRASVSRLRAAQRVSRPRARRNQRQKLAQLETLMHTGQSWYDQREFFLLATARMDWSMRSPESGRDCMRLAKDTRLTLDLAIEALIELLDASGPDSDAEPSLGPPTLLIRNTLGLGHRLSGQPRE